MTADRKATMVTKTIVTDSTGKCLINIYRDTYPQDFYICGEREGNIVATRITGYAIRDGVECPSIYKQVRVGWNKTEKTWQMVHLYTGLVIKRSKDKWDVWNLTIEDMSKLSVTLLGLIMNAKSVAERLQRHKEVVKRAFDKGEAVYSEKI